MESAHKTRPNVLGIASMTIAMIFGGGYLGLSLPTTVVFPAIALASILGAIALWMHKPGSEYGLVGSAVATVTLLMVWVGFTL